MPYKVCDIHAHIVPEIDDGSNSLNMSIEMLRMASEQGARSIACTSHSWGNKKKYSSNLELLIKQISYENININLCPGCEINCSISSVDDIIDWLNNGVIFTINGSNYILIEFDPYVEAEEIMWYVQRLHKSGYHTIVAHVERYQSLLAQNKWLSLLQKEGALFQINAYSLQDERNESRKEFARQLLKEKRVTFIGSDSHRMNHRPYMINNGVDYIYQHCDHEYAMDICYRNAERILNMK